MGRIFSRRRAGCSALLGAVPLNLQVRTTLRVHGSVFGMGARVRVAPAHTEQRSALAKKIGLGTMARGGEPKGKDAGNK